MPDPINPYRQLVKLAYEAIENPAMAHTARRNDLLVAADDFLTQCTDGEPDLLRLARAMAYAAMDWSVFGGDVLNLKNCYHAFRLAVKAKELSQPSKT